MRALAAVFAREIFARRLVFPVALAAGFMPIVGSLAYGWSTPDAAEGRILVGFVTATALSIAFALLLGGSVIVGETSERRISFFFTRPISAAAIWGGKVLAAVFITLASALVTFTPAWLTGPGRTRGLWGFNPGLGETLLGALALAFLLVLGSHAVVTIGRLRSPWVALDLLLAPAFVLLVAASVFSLVRDQAFAAIENGGSADLPPLFGGLVAVLLIALAAGSYTQVAAGRTDARRAHGAFSVVLWGILGTATAALGGYAWWVASARATDLASADGGVLAAPRGSWTMVVGPLRAARGYGRFLFDASGSRSIRVRGYDAAFSADGARAAWGEERFGLFERGRRSDVHVADLASARTVDSGIECSPWSRIAMSPSGRRLAVLDGNNLAAYDVTRPDKPQQLAAFRLEGESRHAVFVDEDLIRLFPRFYNPSRKDVTPAALEITVLSLPSKKFSVTGRFERETLPYLRLSADGRLFVGVREKRLTLHDGRTGALLATLSEDLESPKMRFLSGDRIVVAGVANGKAILKIFLEGESAPALLVDLGPAASVFLGGEIAPGRVTVALNPFRSNDERSRPAWTLAFVDVATGAVSSGPDGLVPADRFSWWFSPVVSPGEAGLPSSTLFLDADGRLVRLDPATGAQTVLLGRSK